jgi:prefoldin subunit 5
MSDVPTPVKMMLAALSLTCTLAIGTGAYAFTSLAEQVQGIDSQGSSALRERIAISQTEITYLKEALARIERKLEEVQKELRDR